MSGIPVTPIEIAGVSESADPLAVAPAPENGDVVDRATIHDDPELAELRLEPLLARTQLDEALFDG
jgi:hypothetical protein